MKDIIILTTSFLILFLAFACVIIGIEEDNKRYVAQLEARIEVYNEHVTELEKELKTNEQHMDDVVRCVISGEW